LTSLSDISKTALFSSIMGEFGRRRDATRAAPLSVPLPRDALVAIRAQRRQRDAAIPFPLEDTTAALASDPPRWPPSTIDRRKFDISLRFVPSGLRGLEA
jgi:predicted YcjX-like family ATPase